MNLLKMEKQNFMYGGNLNIALVSEDTCPKCLGEIGSQFYCTNCKYDASPEVFALAMYQMEDLLRFLKPTQELLEI